MCLFSSCTSSEKIKDEDSSNYQVDLEGYSPLDSFISENSKEENSTTLQTWQSFPADTLQTKKSSHIKSSKNAHYTIQVIISDNLIVVDSLKLQLRTLLPELKQEVVYDPPFYKLRVGEFQTKVQANKFLNILEKNGYITSRLITDKRR